MSNNIKIPQEDQEVLISKIKELWDEYPKVEDNEDQPDNLTIAAKIDLIARIENGYIFGEFAENKHFRRKDLDTLIQEVVYEKNPSIAPVVEEESEE